MSDKEITKQEDYRRLGISVITTFEEGTYGQIDTNAWCLVDPKRELSDFTAEELVKALARLR